MKQFVYAVILGGLLSLASVAEAQDPAVHQFEDEVVRARVQLPVQVYVPRSRDVVETAPELRTRFVREVVRTVQRRPF